MEKGKIKIRNLPSMPRMPKIRPHAIPASRRDDNDDIIVDGKYPCAHSTLQSGLSPSRAEIIVRLSLKNMKQKVHSPRGLVRQRLVPHRSSFNFNALAGIRGADSVRRKRP